MDVIVLVNVIWKRKHSGISKGRRYVRVNPQRYIRATLKCWLVCIGNEKTIDVVDILYCMVYNDIIRLRR